MLDTARGIPAQGLAIELHIVTGAERRRLAAATTNADGRTGAPLLSSDRLETGVYELSFHAADYFRGAGATTSDPPFLGTVVVRFGVSDPEGDYHVPLLLSPFAYSTYRGS